MPVPSFIKTLSLETKKEHINLDFDSVRLRIVSPEEMLSWSHGEITRPETINYRTQKPEKDGLFCQKIFGPVKDWECACGKYKKIRYRGIICDRCRVEVTRAIVRRKRMGHISLAAPIAHIWFFRNIPSRIGLILGMTMKSLQQIIYFANFVITEVNEERKKEVLKKLDQEYKQKKKEIKQEQTEQIEQEKQLKERYVISKKEISDLKIKNIITEGEYQNLSLKYGEIFKANIGTEAILELLTQVDLKKLKKELQEDREKTKTSNKKIKIIKRLKLVESFIKNKIKPEWMVLKVIPVIPPDLRPMVQLDGGRFASSDLNDLYRRIINRNNRLKRLIELKAPEVICRNEKRMLQEAVDALIDNEARSQKTITTSTGGRRPLKSLASILRGKEGLFRRNLLGKRVDYSGRSVIVVGPQLKLHQCGLPKIMAIELFKPFVIGELIKQELCHNVKSANRMIIDGREEIWDILEKITQKSYVLLNRAPTLHRLSIQAFQPVLIEGKAIQLHPMVCEAFNADFDGDQMAVHLPITEMAKKEAKEIMLADKNLLKPATGDPIMRPTKDLVWGCYWLTMIDDQLTEKNKIVFGNFDEAKMAYDLKKIKINQLIKIKIDSEIIQTSLGKILFSQILPESLKTRDKLMNKKELDKLIKNTYELYGRERTVQLLDDLKELSLKYLTVSGLSWGIKDLPKISNKEEQISKAETEVDKINKQFEQGFLTEKERLNNVITVWIKTTHQVTDIAKEIIPKQGAVFTMVDSGARGSWTQLAQMIGMKGLVTNPLGQIIELPIRSNFYEGFSVIEYFIATHGSRKGVTDTALRTASAGYLTRRMIDSSQDVFITEEDCGNPVGIVLTKQESEKNGASLMSRVVGRYILQDVYDPKHPKKIIIKKGKLVTSSIAQQLEKLDLAEIRVRSVLNCRAKKGVCAKCYGYDLAYLKPIKLGTAVGIIAAQSIGEPGTQLTLRTFHTGGVVGRDITQGLPRVEELLEARSVKNKALLAYTDGRIELIKEKEKIKKIRIKDVVFKGKESYVFNKEIDVINIKVKHDQRVNQGDLLFVRDKKEVYAKHSGQIKITNDNKSLSVVDNEYKIEFSPLVQVKDKQMIKKGDILTEGSVNLAELYSLTGRLAVQKYILQEIQYIYSSQGQKLNDKHIEIIARQMFSRCKIVQGGDTNLLPGQIISLKRLKEMNSQVKKGEQLAVGKELLLGLTKVAMNSDSFLSSASFQETSRALIDSAISCDVDELRGLKENVILGKLIPVGTNFHPEKK